MIGTTAVVAAVMTGLYAWFVLAASIVAVVALWAAMYYLAERFPERHSEETDPTEPGVTE